MKKSILIYMAGLLLISFNAFADDVSIDSSGNVKTGVSNANAELEVTGASGEGGILGSASGTGASGVYGINTTYGNYGILGYDSYGVFGYSLGNWAGYFQGNTRVTGNLTVDGTVSGPNIGDITSINAGTGLTGGGTGGNVTLNANTTYLQRRVSSSCTVGSSIMAINEDGTVLCQTDNVGITSETDPKVGVNLTNYIPKWNGSALVSSSIYDNGKVGIGTSYPNAKLEVFSSSSLGISSISTGGYYAISGNSQDAAGIVGSSNTGKGVYGQSLSGTGGFFTSTSGYGLIVANGNVGIGTTTPSSKLSVSGTIESTSGGVKFPDGTIQATAANGIQRAIHGKVNFDGTVLSGSGFTVQYDSRDPGGYYIHFDTPFSSPPTCVLTPVYCDLYLGCPPHFTPDSAIISIGPGTEGMTVGRLTLQIDSQGALTSVSVAAPFTFICVQ